LVEAGIDEPLDLRPPRAPLITIRPRTLGAGLGLRAPAPNPGARHGVVRR